MESNAHVHDLWQDFRYAIRGLRLTPDFTVVSIAVLALGIGLTTSMFTVVNAVLLRPLPYPHANRLMWLGLTFPSIHAEIVPSWDYVQWQQANQSFAGITALANNGTNEYDFTAGGEPLRIAAAPVTSSFFDVFGVQPDIGRSFNADENRPGGALAVVLSYPFWRREFGGRSSTVGSKVTIDGKPYTIVGVMPKWFRFPGDLEFDALVPRQLDLAVAADRRRGALFHAFGRLKPGVTREQAESDLGRFLANEKRQFPFFYRSDNRLVVVPLQEHENTRIRVLLLVLLGAVGFVLLIACANVAHLLLARSAARQREVAVRLALGASRARLLRHGIVESSILGFSGGLLGVGIAVLSSELLRKFAVDLPRHDTLVVDVRVLLFACVMSLLTGFVLGLAPGTVAWSGAWQQFLKEGGVSSTRSSKFARRVLVIAEMALSLILIAGAGLLLESFWKLQRVPLGFAPERVLAARIGLAAPQYRDRSRKVEFWQRAVAAVGALPGVESAALSAKMPTEGTPEMMTFSRFGAPPPEPGHRGDNVLIEPVSQDYFRTMGIPLLHGLEFVDGMAPDAPLVAVANQAFASKYFPNEDAIGKRVMGHLNDNWKVIIGVVGNAKNQGVSTEVQPEIYIPYEQADNIVISPMVILTRTAMQPQFIIPEMNKAIHAIDPARPVIFTTVEENLSSARARPRLNATLLTVFAAIALALSIFGVYGVLSYTTAQRTREIGVRMALGASPTRILWWSMSGAMRMVIVGIVLGIAGTLMLSRYLSSLLFEVRPHDALVMGTGSVLLMLAALAACWIPAQRAASVDPVISLRSQ